MKQSTIRALDSFLNEEKESRNYEGLPVTFKNNPGLNSAHTDSFSHLKIPSDYIDLLEKHNGFTLFQYEDIGGFNFFGVDQLQIETDLQKETYEEEWDDRIIIIGNVIGDGDFIGLRILENGGYEVLDGYHDEAPQNWNTITDSLDDFFLKLIESKGERYWLQ